MFLGGPAGSGKSCIMNALNAYFMRAGQDNWFLLTSYMGVTAQNIGGNTLHSVLNLGQNTSKPSQKHDNSDLMHMWDGVDYLLVDEVSMVGVQMMQSISEALCAANGNNLPFGNVSIIFVGDFTQLPPIGQHLLVSCISIQQVTDPRVQWQIFGKLLWYTVDTVVLLLEVKRQSGDKNACFVQLLAQLQEGKCTEDDYHLLQTQTLTSVRPSWDDEGWLQASIIVTSNAVNNSINKAVTRCFAEHTGWPLHWYYCTDIVKGSPVDPTVCQSSEMLHSGETNLRLGRLLLVIGMPVMITHNFDVQSGIVNGSTGTLT